ncbi:MAG: aminopeptidase [Oscillospiraceae bacterium]|nr:aminopeptidase [Oscillospiraceae bacterium]
MKKTVLRQYARLIVQTGANVQPGQEVFIFAGLDQPEFVKMVAEECYRRKADRVVVNWDYQPLQKLDYRRRTLRSLKRMDEYETARWAHMAEKLTCRIYLESEDPDGLSGVNAAKMSAALQARYRVIKPYRDKMENRHQWCIAAVPGTAWAKKVFPDLPARQATEKLWQAILDTCRVGEDPMAAWEAHNRALQEYCAWLNSLHIERLHYTASNGTDFTVGMIPEGRFCGGSEATIQGVVFNPNLPTEECFISPMRGQAEGVVYATKPLCYQGQLIENFSIRFHEGKAVEWHAEKNEALLGELIGMDEGSAYLGECALVPYDSPISRSGLLFYNTLFDENAACHLALGKGFADTIEGFTHRTQEEVRALGVNESMMHEDFMIGSPDMRIDAICRDGSVVPVFRNGNWAK